MKSSLALLGAAMAMLVSGCQSDLKMSEVAGTVPIARPADVRVIRRHDPVRAARPAFRHASIPVAMQAEPAPASRTAKAAAWPMRGQAACPSWAMRRAATARPTTSSSAAMPKSRAARPRPRSAWTDDADGHMETKAGDPGAFARFDLARVPTPAFVVDAAKVRANLAILKDVRDRGGIKMLAALKAFSMWSLGPTVASYLDGVCASGIYEARLGREEYAGPNGDKEVATYCAGYKAEDLPDICALSDHIIFNSPGQIARFRPILDAARKGGNSFDVGLRINPLHAEGEVAKYDPASRTAGSASRSRSSRPSISTASTVFISIRSASRISCRWAAPGQPSRLSLKPHFGRLKWLEFRRRPSLSPAPTISASS